MASYAAVWTVSRLIHKRPVVRIPFVGTVVNDAAIGRAAMADPRFIKDGGHNFAEMYRQVFGAGVPMNSDGEHHRALRRTVAPMFSSRAAARLRESHVQGYVDDVRDRLHRGERVDFARFSALLSGMSTCRMVGLRADGPELEERALLTHRHTVDVGRRLGSALWKPLSARTIEAARESMHVLTDGIEDAWREQDPDTVAGLLAASGTPLEQTRGIVGTLLVAGVDTTASALVRMVTLLVDSEQLELLRGANEKIPGAVDESLRYAAAVPLITRWCPEHTELGGTTVRADSPLIVFVRNCMHDEHALDSPGDFDISRQFSREMRNLWFGFGPHSCPGQAIAREVLGCVAEMLASLDGTVRIASRRPLRRALFPSYTHLELELVR